MSEVSPVLVKQACEAVINTDKPVIEMSLREVFTIGLTAVVDQLHREGARAALLEAADAIQESSCPYNGVGCGHYGCETAQWLRRRQERVAP